MTDLGDDERTPDVSQLGLPSAWFTKYGHGDWLFDYPWSPGDRLTILPGSTFEWEVDVISPKEAGIWKVTIAIVTDDEDEGEGDDVIMDWAPYKRPCEEGDIVTITVTSRSATTTTSIWIVKHVVAMGPGQYELTLERP